jgi:hypothetical protein
MASPRHEVDVIGDVLLAYFEGVTVINGDELAAELDHYARIMRAKAPHATSIGKRLSALGYTKEKRESVGDGKKVSIYRHKMRAVKRA